VAVAVEAVEQFTRRAMVDLEEERLITQVLQHLAGLEHLDKVTLEEAFNPELPDRAKAAVAAVDLAAQAVMSTAAWVVVMVVRELRHLSPGLQHSMQVVVAAAQSPGLLGLVVVALAVSVE